MHDIPSSKVVHKKSAMELAKNPRVSIVILNWNGWKDTVECLTSLKTLNYPNYDIIVVDNGSTDGSVEKIIEKFPTITLIRNSKNLGFAEGNNIGIRYALRCGVSYVLILNNDTVVTRNFLSKMVNFAEKSDKVGIIGPKIYLSGSPEKVWFAGGNIDKSGVCRPLQFNKTQRCDFVIGCSMLIRREVLEHVGLFDPRYFLLFEDTDLSMRAKSQGYEIYYFPESEIRHKASKSFNGTWSSIYYYYYVRNNLIFTKKHLGGYAILLTLLRYIRKLRAMIRSDEEKKYKKGFYIFKGVADFLLGKTGKESPII